ncbi:hypothetical protein BXZ70DRAFT_1077256 [Cristinia sonorae]|uniref:Uncharacterized protein n=1 Tax=Cristinia sonorae TaxID=1940300 RepID=A0A8K0XQC1_9AGAR|nr:hypothetical protein BXZ70DRAFT_1077256 [Cristinia sonorae]
MDIVPLYPYVNTERFEYLPVPQVLRKSSSISYNPKSDDTREQEARRATAAQRAPHRRTEFIWPFKIESTSRLKWFVVFAVKDGQGAGGKAQVCWHELTRAATFKFNKKGGRRTIRIWIRGGD